MLRKKESRAGGAAFPELGLRSFFPKPYGQPSEGGVGSLGVGSLGSGGGTVLFP